MMNIIKYIKRPPRRGLKERTKNGLNHESKVRTVKTVLTERTAPKVLKGTRVTKATKVILAQQDLKVIKVRPVHKDQRVIKVIQANQERPAHQVMTVKTEKTGQTENPPMKSMLKSMVMKVPKQSGLMT